MKARECVEKETERALTRYAARRKEIADTPEWKRIAALCEEEAIKTKTHYVQSGEIKNEELLKRIAQENSSIKQ